MMLFGCLKLDVDDYWYFFELDLLFVELVVELIEEF